MGNGIQSEIEAIKAIDVFEFWTLYDLWLERTKAKNDRAKQQNNKR